MSRIIFLFLFAANILLIILLSVGFKVASDNYVYGLENKTAHSIALLKPTPTLTPTPTIKKVSSPPKTTKQEVWGVAQKIDENTWTMKVAGDKKMALAQEILEALNNYRQKKGAGTLSWDQKLADFAQSRAETFASLGKLDSHEGFNQYFQSEENLKNMGFWGVGENSSFGFQMEAVHLIEWVYAGDPPHDNNQLDPSWSHVGIGTKGTASDLIFGKNKM